MGNEVLSTELSLTAATSDYFFLFWVCGFTLRA